MRRLLALAAFYFLSGGVGFVTAAESPKTFLSLNELVKLGGDSKVSYAFEIVEEPGEFDRYPILEPGAGRDFSFPRVTTSASGIRYLLEYEFLDSSFAALSEAKPLFRRGEFGVALARYEEAVKVDPDCYVLHSHVGDCLQRMGFPEEALTRYRQAISLNPVDFRAHWFAGDALLKLDRVDEARQSYVRALALKPAHPSLLQILKQHASVLGVEIRDERFLAPARAYQGDGRVPKQQSV